MKRHLSILLGGTLLAACSLTNNGTNAEDNANGLCGGLTCSTSFPACCPQKSSLSTKTVGFACTDLQTDPNNCGACGTTCPSQACVGGFCLGEQCDATTCPPPQTCCPGSGCVPFPVGTQENCVGCGPCGGDYFCCIDNSGAPYCSDNKPSPCGQVAPNGGSSSSSSISESAASSSSASTGISESTAGSSSASSASKSSSAGSSSSSGGSSATCTPNGAACGSASDCCDVGVAACVDSICCTVSAGLACTQADVCCGGGACTNGTCDNPCVGPGSYCDSATPCCGTDGTFCIDNSCLYSGGLPDSGFCFGAGLGSDCTYAPCCAGSTCSGGAGACYVSQGGFCDNLRQCTGQLQCYGDAPAGANGVEPAGICQSFSDCSGDCSSTQPCTCPGYTCSSSTATLGSCAYNGAGNAPIGSSCAFDPDCATMDCDPVSGLCCTGIGSACSLDSDCCGGSYAPKLARCENAACCLPTGAWCQSYGLPDATCCSDSCDTAGQCL